jgi:hypothetical protein
MRMMLCAALLLVGFVERAQADYIYSLDTYNSQQNGWTISGTVTTDTNTGVLSTADILSWMLTLTKPGNATISFSGNTTNATALNLEATPSSLTLSGANASLYLLVNSNIIVWDRQQGFYYSVTSGSQHWAESGASISLPTPDTWVVASAGAAPEPATISLAIVGLVMLGVAYLIRRCRTATPLLLGHATAGRPSGLAK